MRSVLVVLLVTSAALLAGCSDDGGHEHETYTCPDGTELDLEAFPDHDNETFNPLAHCSGGSTTNSATLKPNVLPTLVLTSTDDGGNVTNVTMLDGNLTFSADGSTDSDGTITGIAVSVTDSNTTRTATLYDSTAKAFKPATFKFDRPGIVNVTVAMVDDRAGFTVSQSQVYVNHLQAFANQNIALPGGPSGATGGGPCSIGEPISGAQFWKMQSFALAEGATLVEAIAEVDPEAAVGDVAITICDPAAAPLSDAGNPTVTTSAGPFPAAVGTDTYFIGVTATGGPRVNFIPTILVHYEPGAVATFVAA